MTIFDVVFAHHDEPIDAPNLPPANLTERQLKRWKSRRMANFLLRKLFEKHHLDEHWLADIHRTESGRPYVDLPHIDFNITHSGDWVAVIFSYSFANEKKAVGIDLEHPQKTRRFEALIRHYANDEEIEQLLETNMTPLPELASRFYLSWCLREAVLKSQGVGIVKLSEVQHLPTNYQINTAYSPSGYLMFYHQFPFFLAYFMQESEQSIHHLFQWKVGELQKIEQFQPLVYRVN